jgi:hypothetical protein
MWKRKIKVRVQRPAARAGQDTGRVLDVPKQLIAVRWRPCALGYGGYRVGASEWMVVRVGVGDHGCVTRT